MPGNITLTQILRISLAAVALLLPALPAAAQSGASYIAPAEIDRAVEQFTGQPAGSIGGATTPADPRLRLRACKAPLALEWHGVPGRTVAVSCPAHQGWRIYVSILNTAAAAQSGPAIKRGETVTLLVRGHGFSVQRQGEATSSGKVGDWISVRTGRRADPVRARVERPGLVVIPTG